MNIASNWLNLAVADLSVSEGFYQALGFTIKHNEAMQAKMLGIETADENYYVNRAATN